MTKKTKLTILTQHMITILTHCHPLLPWGRICQHVNHFMKKLQFSGYTKKFRYHVADSAIKAFRQMMVQAMTGIRPVNRPRHWNKEERERERKKKKTEWYKRGGFDSVLFIPATPDGKLRRTYQHKMAEKGIQIKIVELSGTKLKHKLQKTDPFKDKLCEREDCFPCRTGGKGGCNKESVTYNIKCGDETCERKNIYNGETSFNGYTRGKEHENGLNNRAENNCLWRHAREEHNGIPPPYTMTIDNDFKNDTMLRQIMEAVNIQNTPEDNTMNTRAEWNMPRVPRAQIIDT